MLRGVQVSNGYGKRMKKLEEEAWGELGVLGEERKEWSVYGLKGGLGTLVDVLERKLEERGVEIRRGESVEGLKRDGEGVNVSFVGNFGTFSDRGKNFLNPTYDWILTK